MNKILQRVFAFFFVVILVSCGANQNDTAAKQLTTGISPITKSAEFGKPASSEALAALTKELGSYFNGQYASNPKALMGVQSGSQSSIGKRTVTSQAVAVSNIPKEVFRFYNTNTGAHFFTMSVIERDHIKNTYPFFSYEGSKFLAFPEADPALSPVYRFYNNLTGTHFFTISEAEKDKVIATWPTIFSYEGVAWHASTASATDLVPVYRFFNKRTGTHFYTASETEKDHIVATWDWFTFEGIAYFVLPEAPYTCMGSYVGTYDPPSHEERIRLRNLYLVSRGIAVTGNDNIDNLNAGGGEPDGGIFMAGSYSFETDANCRIIKGSTLIFYVYDYGLSGTVLEQRESSLVWSGYGSVGQMTIQVNLDNVISGKFFHPAPDNYIYGVVSGTFKPNGKI